MVEPYRRGSATSL